MDTITRERYKSWIEQNPGTALWASLAGGFILGSMGVAKVLAGVEAFRAFTKFSPDLTKEIASAFPGTFSVLGFGDSVSGESHSGLKH